MLASTTPAQEGLIIIGIFVGIIVVGAVAVYRDFLRRRNITGELKAAGFDVREGERPFEPVEDAVIADNPLLRYTRNKVRWSATIVHKGNVVRLYEYYFTTGYGRARENHYFLIATTDLPVNLPEFTIERKRFWKSHLPDTNATVPPTNDPRVAAAFDCYATDASGASALLSRTMCDELSTWDKKPFLRFADGTLIVGRRGLGRMPEINGLLDSLSRTFGAALSAAQASQSPVCAAA